MKAWMPKTPPDRQYEVEDVPLNGHTITDPVVVSVSLAKDLVANANPGGIPEPAQDPPQTSAKPWRFEAVQDGFGGG